MIRNRNYRAFFFSLYFWNICWKTPLSKTCHSIGISHLICILNCLTRYYVVTGVCCEEVSESITEISEIHIYKLILIKSNNNLLNYSSTNEAM